MSKKTIITLSVLLIISAIGFLVLYVVRGANNTPDIISFESQPENPIFYSDSGFSPSSIDLAIGEELTVINKSNVSLWITGDNKSLAIDKNIKDSRGIGPDEEFIYKFTKKGTYKLINKLSDVNNSVIVSVY